MINNSTSIFQGYLRRQKRWKLTVFLLLLSVISLAVIMLTYGNTVYSMSTVIKVILGEEIKGATFTIKTLRIPRLLAALLTGFSFGMSGYVFQTLLKNPLASPDIIGVSSGTSAVAVFCLLLLNLDQTLVSVISVIAGIVIALFIYALSVEHGKFSTSKMILIGIGVQAMLKAFTSFLLLKASEYDVAATLQWLNGSLNNIKMDKIPRLFFVVVVATIILLSLSKHMLTIQLGEDYAVTLGVNTKTIYIVLIVSAVCLVAFSTAVTGPIASVAFLAGPIATKLAGHGKSNLLVAGLVGIVLVQASDLIGQYAFATRYPVGVITGILGAPYLLFLLIAMNKKGERV